MQRPSNIHVPLKIALHCIATTLPSDAELPTYLPVHLSIAVFGPLSMHTHTHTYTYIYMHIYSDIDADLHTYLSTLGTQGTR